MAGVRHDNFTGIDIGTWSVGDYIGKNKYRVTCKKCGFTRELIGYFIKNNDVPACSKCGDRAIKTELTDKMFGKWKVLYRVSTGREARWHCLCTCGCNIERDVLQYTLLNGSSRGCGRSRDAEFNDLSNKVFGCWTVKRFNSEKAKWECECNCEDKTKRLVSTYQLVNGTSKSCGHSTTGFKDLTDSIINGTKIIRQSEYSVSKSESSWVCECKYCGKKFIAGGYELRSGKVDSCGCNTNTKREETCLNKYGVRHVAQTGTQRTQEQLRMIESKENLEKAIKDNFSYKPKTEQVGNVLGLSRAGALRFIYKYNIEDIVDIGKDKVSSYENEIKDIFPGAIASDRKVLNGKELDLLYTDEHIAIEFNGDYWHNDLRVDKLYHQKKTLEANKNGVRVIHIFEYEWNNNDTKRKLLSLIRKALGRDKNNVIYARECSVKEITGMEASEFLDKNHLQGRCSSSINIGTFIGDRIIGVMSFGAPRFSGESEYELIRLAWEDDISAVGGTEKMFKYFLRNYNPKSIISYCDLSKFTGRTYIKLGFKIERISEPNYKWVDSYKNIVLSRYQTMKQKLIDAGLGNESETESEIMYRLGYLRIYDCGNIRFIWNNNDKTEE